ncbi:MAG: T9SS type A sorting domain-containing protein, partial [Bacteroidota bacterium]|nr:T9SS type A sorting domain-containing protein [Bacteroidota bacterium]
STILDVGAHGAELLLSSTSTDRRITVTYVIRKSTGISKPQAPGAFTLDVWPQPVPVGARLSVRISGEAGERSRLTLHDLLGRMRAELHAQTATTEVFDPGALQLPAGIYLLRAVSGDGAQAVRMIVVTGSP